MMLKSEPIQFFFELASPYSYIASLEVDKVAASAGRSVEWCPIELAMVWEAYGVLGAYTAIRRLKRPYILRDAIRSAKAQGITFARPSAPATDTSLAKLAYWGLRHNDAALAKRFLQSVWHRYFGEGKPIGALNDLADASEEIGLGAQQIQIAAAWAGTRHAQDRSNADAVRSGCFGVPWFIADGEYFFGQDRLGQLAEHIKAKPD
jgi:2-hydroxychromene-2-carboxylate isomerase